MVDGLDGVGKTTQIQLLSKQLQQAGWKVKTSRINGGTPIGEELRTVMLSGTARTGETDLYIAMAMYTALGVQLAKWRDESAIILIDRSPLSIVAYQAYGEKAPLALAEASLAQSLAFLKPDLIVVYDLDTTEALGRDKSKPGQDNDYFTSHDQQFFDDVRSGYQYIADKHKDLVKLIDISGMSSETISAKTLALINSITTASS